MPWQQVLFFAMATSRVLLYCIVFEVLWQLKIYALHGNYTCFAMATELIFCQRQQLNFLYSGFFKFCHGKDAMFVWLGKFCKVHGNFHLYPCSRTTPFFAIYDNIYMICYGTFYLKTWQTCHGNLTC